MPPDRIDDDDEDDDPAASEPYITTAMLKQLSEEVQHGKQHRALSLLDQDAVMQLLEVLHHHIKLGLALFIQRDDGVSKSSAVRHESQQLSAITHVITPSGWSTCQMQHRPPAV
jgi:hypothetical protein